MLLFLAFLRIMDSFFVNIFSSNDISIVLSKIDENCCKQTRRVYLEFGLAGCLSLQLY